MQRQLYERAMCSKDPRKVRVKNALTGDANFEANLSQMT